MASFPTPPHTFTSPPNTNHHIMSAVASTQMLTARPVLAGSRVTSKAVRYDHEKHHPALCVRRFEILGSAELLTNSTPRLANPLLMSQYISA